MTDSYTTKLLKRNTVIEDAFSYLRLHLAAARLHDDDGIKLDVLQVFDSGVESYFNEESTQ